jgi:hypothetical protein
MSTEWKLRISAVVYGCFFHFQGTSKYPLFESQLRQPLANYCTSLLQTMQVYVFWHEDYADIEELSEVRITTRSMTWLIKTWTNSVRCTQTGPQQSPTGTTMTLCHGMCSPVMPMSQYIALSCSSTFSIIQRTADKLYSNDSETAYTTEMLMLDNLPMHIHLYWLPSGRLLRPIHNAPLYCRLSV